MVVNLKNNLNIIIFNNSELMNTYKAEFNPIVQHSPFVEYFFFFGSYHDDGSIYHFDVPLNILSFFDELRYENDICLKPTKSKAKLKQIHPSMVCPNLLVLLFIKIYHWLLCEHPDTGSHIYDFTNLLKCMFYEKI